MDAHPHIGREVLGQAPNRQVYLAVWPYRNSTCNLPRLASSDDVGNDDVGNDDVGNDDVGDLAELLHGRVGVDPSKIIAATSRATRQRRRLAEQPSQEYCGQRAGVDLFLRAQSTYTDAEREDALGVVRYNQAIAQWEFAMGTILDHSHVRNYVAGPQEAVLPTAMPHGA